MKLTKNYQASKLDWDLSLQILLMWEETSHMSLKTYTKIFTILWYKNLKKKTQI